MKTVLCYLLLMSTSYTMLSQDASLDLSIPLAKIQKVFTSLEGKNGDGKMVSYTIDENTITMLLKAEYRDELQIIRYFNVPWYRMTHLKLEGYDDEPVMVLYFDKSCYLEKGYQDDPDNEVLLRNYAIIEIPRRNKEKIKEHFYELQKVAQTIARIGGDGWDIYEKQNDLDTAISKSETALKLYPSLYWVQGNLALFYWLKGDVARSKTHYEETILEMLKLADTDGLVAMYRDIETAKKKYPTMSNLSELETFFKNELGKYE